MQALWWVFLDKILCLIYEIMPHFSVSEQCFYLSLLDSSEFVLLPTVMADTGGRDYILITNLMH